jgi:hypothetical protein
LAIDRFEDGDAPRHVPDRDAGARALEAPELAEVRPRHAEVFDRIDATQEPRDTGSVLPKSFNLSLPPGGKVQVAPNATKHISASASFAVMISVPSSQLPFRQSLRALSASGGVHAGSSRPETPVTRDARGGR